MLLNARPPRPGRQRSRSSPTRWPSRLAGRLWVVRPLSGSAASSCSGSPSLGPRRPPLRHRQFRAMCPLAEYVSPRLAHPCTPWGHDRRQARIKSHSLTRKPAAQLPHRSDPWIWLLAGRYVLPMRQLSLTGQDQRLCCRQLHDAGASWYVQLSRDTEQRPRGSLYSKFLNTYRNDTDMARATAATCGLSDESQSTRVIIAVSFFFVGTAIFVMLRTLSKIMTRTLYAEDHIITLAVTLAMAPFVCVLYSK